MDHKVTRAILDLTAGEEAALVTVISTRGSTPRKAGAQVLFYRDGRSVGTIGGGCGEAEARRTAWEVLRTRQPRTARVELTHELAEADGMVCGGVMEVFIETVSGSGKVGE
ncbi:XdhC and CoxI family [Acididesulfobacillus acetoxydans]|uniref:XdhC and CoxI family n=1 Tax=Acididesulfobacillus acetoxydans TaxID=1561005 RepID=A0A8S0WHX5_9FIRM|nr:XdhC family protein [Acididesulfobacillus acetoxydans]CAA7602982.1 XdhC and CoxI family [Acididesulfobacillus acetoxydans]CEJ05864.1 Hypothetical protein DEACI_0284 [Acididesulfobacillus acetoxydans]